MKTMLFVAAMMIASCVASFAVNSSKATEQFTELQLLNIEALSETEGNDCHYTNGFTSFTGHRGGAYDCCMNWVNLAPKDEHCR